MMPWAPIYTVHRSGLPEVTQYGIICIDNGDKQPLLTLGDEQTPLWSRSLLKPWQLASILPQLQSAYPELSDEQLAMMMASHNGEPTHLQQLESILNACHLSEDWLLCPTSLPMGYYTPEKQQRKLNHPCSGKHLAMVLALQSQNQGLPENYLDSELAIYQHLKDLLAQMLENPQRPFLESIDGCGMPNYALSAWEMSRLYRNLATHDFIDERQSSNILIDMQLSKIKKLMIDYPELIGGQKRLDSDLIAQGKKSDHPLVILAKEGADGLLGVGIGPTPNYPHGLGILIKLAMGYQADVLRRTIQQLLLMIELPLELEAPSDSSSDVLSIQFHLHNMSTGNVVSC